MDCPQCGHQLLEDFGVVTCQNCLTVMSIDLEGKIFLQEKKQAEDSHSADEEKQLEAQTQEQDHVQGDESLIDDDLFSLDSFNQETQDTSVMQEVTEVPAEKLTTSENSLNDLMVPPEEHSHAYDEKPTIEKHFTKEIISFAENTTTSDKLIYKVTIKDLNLTEQKQKLVDILSDPKFHLSAHKLLSEIQEGVLIISDLNSVKASILVRKLLMEKFNIDWSQSAY